MTHEFKNILEQTHSNQKRHLKHVLATVVALDGSSYRKPGVQMLIDENGHITGAVSGGCVEKEVVLQSLSVFKKGMPKVMTYDGRYRLGCEGTLFILLEPFSITEAAFKTIQKELSTRRPMQWTSYFQKEDKTDASFGSVLRLEDGTHIRFRTDVDEVSLQTDNLSFQQEFTPLSRLIIIGAEHDAVQLCKAAAQLGWEVLLIASPNDPKNDIDFQGVSNIYHLNPEQQWPLPIDAHTAIVLMTHNYARDLHFVLQLSQTRPFYIGILGSHHRKEKLLNELIERQPDIDSEFLDTIFSPAGIAIGAITPQEIALSILSEIIAVKRHREVPSLRSYLPNIHP
ncbi:XdhC family protein [Mangrovimonas sp. DI 80]|uniref:XdhC family protein n=1 Tax=Mangrovimonas sp. DI 80 TaxID=1779330 RepID=UPI000976D923|nr:XdhC/CoxI family protein [Mangrovimonas sp. DI 80]OMP32110.1 XshC-Cox1-family protein [Mangrovimonas sp. DI 80]